MSDLALDLGAQRDRHRELCLDGAHRAGVGGLRLGLSRGDVSVELGRRLQLVHARPGLYHERKDSLPTLDRPLVDTTNGRVALSRSAHDTTSVRSLLFRRVCRQG